MSKPVAIDLCAELGGWTRGLMAEGWDCIGFDIEKHEYGDKRYPAELILQDITTLCGYDLRAINPALVVASPPCQKYSYMAMPWKRGKALAAAIRADESGAALADLNALLNACFRIAREIGCPIVLENVKGAQPWVGRAKAHYGSYYLWGDVADVGGRVVRADVPVRFGEYVRPSRARRNGGRGVHLTSQRENTDGVKQAGHSGRAWFADPDVAGHFSSKSDSRKAASAMIAEIPFGLAQYVARAFKPSVAVEPPSYRKL